MTLFATAGSHFFIGTARQGWCPDEPWPVGFVDELWTEVVSVQSLGRLGGEWDLKVWQDQGSAYARQEKTFEPVRRMQVVVGLEEGDAGQLLLLTAERSKDPFAFKIELPNGATRFFVALVVGLEEVFDEVNGVLGLGFTLSIAGDVERA